MRSAIIILSGWRFLSAFLRKKSPLGVFSRADPELSSYPFWLKLKMLSHPMWGYLSEYFRHLLSFSAKTLFSKQTLFKWRAETVRPFCNAASELSPGLFKNGYMVWCLLLPSSFLIPFHVPFLSLAPKPSLRPHWTLLVRLCPCAASAPLCYAAVSVFFRIPLDSAQLFGLSPCFLDVLRTFDSFS